MSQRQIAQQAINAAVSLFSDNSSSPATNRVNQANTPPQPSAGAGNKSNSPSSDHQVRDTGYKRTLDKASGKHVVPATGKY